MEKVQTLDKYSKAVDKPWKWLYNSRIKNNPVSQEDTVMNKENIKKVVLAYSGGLDTSIIIPWLKENYNNRFRQRGSG